LTRLPEIASRQYRDDATDAYALKRIADATDGREPLPPLTATALDKFIRNEWVRRVDEAARRFAITEAGRLALIDWRGRNSR
jgi:hypothetical protein